MSVWTHAAGVIRVDSARTDGSKKEIEKLKEIIGRECVCGSPTEVWEDQRAHPDAYMPCGSEGTLRMSLWRDPDKSHCAAYTISIFGDLRDYSGGDRIIKWFKETCDKIYWFLAIRAAVIEVYCDMEDTKVWSWNMSRNDDYTEEEEEDG